MLLNPFCEQCRGCNRTPSTLPAGSQPLQNVPPSTKWIFSVAESCLSKLALRLALICSLIGWKQALQYVHVWLWSPGYAFLAVSWLWLFPGLVCERESEPQLGTRYSSIIKAVAASAMYLWSENLSLSFSFRTLIVNFMLSLFYMSLLGAVLILRAVEQ